MVRPSRKALILSGGGGRGAYHIGAIEALIEHGWMQDGRGPDIIAGTSIGAVNAAALASGMTVAQLKQQWLTMRTEQVHCLSRDLPAATRPLLRFLLHSVLTSESPASDAGGLPADTPPEHSEPPDMGPGRLIHNLTDLFKIRPFRSLLDTTPWRKTLSAWIDFERINTPEPPALILTATELHTGTLQTFCTRDLKQHPRDTITMDHILASCSIPGIYPWTEIDGEKYWDGAILANTPLGPVIDLAEDEDVDIVVVMMTPWHENQSQMHHIVQRDPQDLMQAMTLTLDWSLLASYRVALKMLHNYNLMAEAAERLERAAQQTGDDSLRMPNLIRPRISLPTVISPQKLLPLDWIIDYEQANHEALFTMGKMDAEKALTTREE